MSTTTVTVKPSAIDALTPANLKRLDAAVTAVLAMEPTAARTLAAVERVNALKVGTGLSGRGVAAILAARTNGAASVATVARLIAVGDALAPLEAFAAYGKDARASIAGDLYTVAGRPAAQGGGTQGIRDAVEIIGKSRTESDAVLAASAAKTATYASAARDAVTPPTRAPQIASEREDAPEASDAVQVAAAQTGAGEAASLSTRALIAALHARVTARGFTPDDVLTEAFDALAVAFETARETVTA